MIQPHLDYCAPVWSAASETLRNGVAVLQRKAIGAVINYQEHVTPELFDRVQITPVFERWKRMEAVWLYKIRSDTASIPPYMKELVVFTDLSATYNLRRSQRVEHTAQKKIGNSTLAARVRLLFRKLPEELWRSESLNVFRRKLALFTLVS